MTTPPAKSWTISKLEAARRQLRVAGALFFENGDAVALHTLVAAARQVLIDLLERQGKALRLDEHLRARYTEQGQKMWYSAKAQAENFFKHADRDPDAQLEFNPTQTHFLLLDCAEAYNILTGRQLRELWAFTTWFFLEYPDALEDGPFKDTMARASALLAGAHRDRSLFMAAFRSQASLPDFLD